LSTSESENSTLLPAPISLTLEEAMQVAGGSAAGFSQFVHDFIINGTPAPSWISNRNLLGELQFNVNLAGR
jgi:hypothetical protein